MAPPPFFRTAPAAIPGGTRAERLHYGYDQLREVYRGTNSCPAAARYIVTELIEAFYVEQLTIDTP